MLFNYLFLNAIKAYNERMKIFIIAGIFNLIVGLILTYFYGIAGMSVTVVLTEFILLLLGIRTFMQNKSHMNSGLK